MSSIFKNKSKCCFLISSLSGGGAEGVCVSVASGVAEAGVETELVVLNLLRSTYIDRVSSQVNLVNLHVRNARYAFLPLIKHLNKTKPNIVIAFNYELAFVMIIIKPFLSFKCRIIARNINTISSIINNKSISIKKALLRSFMIRLYSRVDHIVNQCEAMRSDLHKVLRISKLKTSVIYNPVNSCFESRTKDTNKSNNQSQPYILCAGRLTEQKAFHLAIGAFALFLPHYPQFRLKIVGQGELENSLKDIANLKGVIHNIDFEGFQSDIFSYYSNAKFTLLTSLYEGFPNVLVESVSIGTPVVAVNCPSGPSEIILEGVNGFLVNSRSEQAIAAAMVRASEHQWSCKEIALTATRYSSRNIIVKWCQLFDSITESH